MKIEHHGGVSYRVGTPSKAFIAAGQAALFGV